MNTERIKEIQSKTAYPESVSVQQALLQVWNETEQEQLRKHAVSGLLPSKGHCFECNNELNKEELFCSYCRRQ